MKIAGIDWSMSCPAMTIVDTETNTYDFYYLHKSSSKIVNEKHIHSQIMRNDYSSVNRDIADFSIGSSIQRFIDISEWFVDKIVHQDVKQVFMEGYSLGSKGKVFSIAENTAILKKFLFDINVDTVIIPPTVIKKFATGKGNAKKEMMIDFFLESSTAPSELKKLLNEVKSTGRNIDTSPYADIVDSFWILMTGLNSF